ncbi:mitochondrial protein [Cylindrobasidium torrendii FP15055 ss-10]|uniref:Mitochondrial protein n=1 Tax=Cylindrobasidium torrendii FP15055 ss-10 TaxID=1314674 RepID=A0A0D7BAL7_9AGAR|nr:mitochondrial protein [Cylindrobasidium torrendii FP15055 ss-10]
MYANTARPLARLSRPFASQWMHPPTRSLHMTRPTQEFHFDTHHFVQRLEREGLNRAQAEGIMTALAEVIDESIRNMTTNMASKAAQEKQHYAQQVDFAQLKSELLLISKNDLAAMKGSHDALVTEVERLKAKLREEITRTQAGVRLDLNLERGRLREEHAKQGMKVRDVDTRIEQEISGLRTGIQQSKATVLQYLVATVTTCAAIMLGYVRLRT